MRHEQIWSGCVGKATYDSKAAALRCVRRRQKRGALGQHPRGEATPYKCGNCHGWHVGSQSARAPGLRR